MWHKKSEWVSLGLRCRWSFKGLVVKCANNEAESLF